MSSSAQQPAAGPQPQRGQPYAASQQPGQGYSGAAAPRYTEPRLGVGAWTGRLLAGVLMIVSGLLSFFTGLAAVLKSGFFTYHTNYAFRWTVHGWGWLDLIVGAVIVAAGMCVFLGMLWARMVGVVLAVLSALASFVFLPFYPLWAIVTIGVDVFLMWALMTSGRPRAVLRLRSRYASGAVTPPEPLRLRSRRAWLVRPVRACRALPG